MRLEDFLQRVEHQGSVEWLEPHLQALVALDWGDPALQEAMARLPEPGPAWHSGHPGEETWSEQVLLYREHVQVSLFRLAAGGRMPLHEHPGMAVMMRVLRGQLQVDSYDWAQLRAPHPPWRATRTASAVQGVFEPPSTLLPHWGNIHTLLALEDTVFLDVIVPPYSPERPYQLFEPLPGQDPSSEEGWWLVPVPNGP
jgi:hypothetical protein